MAAIDSSRTVTATRVLETFGEVAIEGRDAELTLVDIPVGLPSAESPHDRLCDGMVRKELGGRASTVFPVPAREAVWAADYDEASRRNEQILGRKLSLQSWGICPKIREADSVFRLAPGLQGRIRETHPELCFRWLNRGLRGWTTNLDAALKQARGALRGRGVDLDDLLDAVAAAVIARLVVEGKASSVPLAPERDACGLRMEIVGL
jgi:predicted RNase H-like nuclease